MCVGLAVAGAWAGESESSEDVDAVLARLQTHMAETKTVQASFVQKKTLAIMSHTMVIKGRLALQSPGRLAWRVDKPARYVMIADDDTIRQWDEDTDRVQKMSISRQPMLAAVMKQFRNWFSGDYEALQKEYNVELAALKPAVSLRFTPKPDTPGARAVKQVSVTLQSNEQYVHRIHIVDTSGDTTTVTFQDTVLNEAIPESVWRIKPAE